MLLTAGAELDDLTPLGDGVVPVGLFGGGLDGHGVLSAWAEEPVAPDRHGQGHGLGHQLGRNILQGGREEGGRRVRRNFSIYGRLSATCRYWQTSARKHFIYISARL